MLRAAEWCFEQKKNVAKLVGAGETEKCRSFCVSVAQIGGVSSVRNQGSFLRSTKISEKRVFKQYAEKNYEKN